MPLKLNFICVEIQQMITKVGDDDRERNKSANVTSSTSNEETGPYHVQLAVQSKVCGEDTEEYRHNEAKSCIYRLYRVY